MRNTNSYFSVASDVRVPRSRWRAPYNNKFTMSAGKLYPFICMEVLPGDTITLDDMSTLTRMSTPIHPVMDNLYRDDYFFFVPNRLVMDDWKAFMGENTDGEWTTSQPDISMPMLYLNKGMLAGAQAKSLADYMGVPTWHNDQQFISEEYTARIQALPFRAYCLIWNEWFRNQATHPPIPIFKDNQSRALSTQFDPSDPEDYKLSAQFGGALAPVAKFADYFVSALPEPQRGEDVLIGSLSNSVTSVYANDDFSLTDFGDVDYLKVTDENGFPLSYTNAPLTSSEGYLSYYSGGSDVPSSSDGPVNLGNLGFRNNQLDITINQLRQAFAVQRFLEKQAQYGSRYTEMIRSFFGVTSPDSRLQRPEFLGGSRQNIVIQQVLQTSSTDSTSPQGNTAAFSLTANRKPNVFQYSATEHGFIIGLTCIRSAQTYAYGLRRMFTREDKLDYYFPTFANIGNTPIYNKELYQSFTSEDDEVFGYQEAWAEYRYLPSQVCGEFRPQYEQSLDSWHYAEKLDSTPTLSESFINQSALPIDRTLAVSSTLADQFICDFQLQFNMVRCMPVYSKPGLVDHH